MSALHCLFHNELQFMQNLTPAGMLIAYRANHRLCLQGLIAAHHSTPYSPGSFSQLFSGTSVENSPSSSGARGIRAADVLPSVTQSRVVTPKQKRQGLLSQLSALNSEKQGLQAQLLAAQQDAAKYKDESEAARKQSTAAAAAATSLQEKVPISIPGAPGQSATLKCVYINIWP